jgi:hypothetical protein
LIARSAESVGCLLRVIRVVFFSFAMSGYPPTLNVEAEVLDRQPWARSDLNSAHGGHPEADKDFA